MWSYLRGGTADSTSTTIQACRLLLQACRLLLEPILGSDQAGLVLIGRY